MCNLAREEGTILLFSSARSPFVRKVLICAHGTGLIGGITLRPTVVSSTQTDPALCSHNPLGQIPTLVRDDGIALYDSGVICAWLAGLAPQSGLLPADPVAQSDMQRRHALADGAMEAFLRWFGERRRAADPLSATIVAAARAKVGRVFDAWERDAPTWPEAAFDIGCVAIFCALAYADFRFAGEDWRATRPILAAWFARHAIRPSCAATAFQG